MAVYVIRPGLGNHAGLYHDLYLSLLIMAGNKAINCGNLGATFACVQRVSRVLSQCAEKKKREKGHGFMSVRIICMTV